MASPAEKFRKEFGRDPGTGTTESVDDPRQKLERLRAEEAEPQPAPTINPDLVKQLDPGSLDTKSIMESALKSPGFEMTTIGLGSVLGSRVAPKALIPQIAAGALGAAMGAVAPDATRRIAGEAGLDVPPPRTFGKQLEAAVKEGILDVGFTVGARALGDVVRGGGSMLGRVLSQSASDRQTAKEIQKRFNFDLIPTSKGFGIPEAYKAVFGRFPIVRGPIVKGAERTTTGAAEATNRLLFQLGPSVSLAKLGHRMDVLAQTRFRNFRTTVNAGYDKVLKEGEAAGLTIPRNAIAAGDPEKNVMGLAEIAQKIETKFGTSAKHPVTDFIQEHFFGPGGVPADIPINRFKGLMEQLDTAMSQAKKDGFSLWGFMQIKEAAEVAIQKGNVPGQAIPEGAVHPIVGKLNEMDELLAAGSKIFDTPTAQIFNRVRRNRFKIGLEKGGTQDASRLFDIAVKNPGGSRTGIVKEMENILGKKVTKEVAATWVDRQITSNALLKESEVLDAVKKGDVPFDADKLRRATGLDDPKSLRYESTKEIVQAAGLPMKDFELLVTGLEKAANTVPESMSSMMARRGQLAGARGAISLLVAGGIAGSTITGGTDLVTAATFLVVTRGFGKIITNPRMMGLAQDALNPNVGITKRKAALRILNAAAGPIDSRSVNPPEELPSPEQPSGPGVSIGKPNFSLDQIFNTNTAAERFSSRR